MRKAARRASRIIAVLAALVISALFFGCGNKKGGTEKQDFVPNIRAENATVEFDGNAHGIEITGIQDGDEVKYSTDKATWTENITFIDVGEYTIYYLVKRAGYKDTTGSATLVIEAAKITGVSAKDITVVTGENIQPQMIGTQPTDGITYAVNGGEYKDAIDLTDVGRYEIKYKVERENREPYENVFTVTVLPNLGGTYVDRENELVIERDKARLNETEYTITLSDDGECKIGKETVVKDGDAITLGGKRYVKLTEAERVILITVNGEKRYAVGKTENNEAEITFESGKATIEVNNEETIRINDVNYCESIIGGTDIRRSYDTSNVSFTPTENVKITLSKRKTQQIESVTQTVLYDGKAHAFSSEYENVLYLTDGEYKPTPQAYSAAGEYEYSAVVIRDGYLPCFVQFRLIIAEDKSGVYVSEDGVLEISEATAKLNGAAVEYIPGVHGGTIDGKLAEYTYDGITINGTEYVKTTDDITGIICNGTVTVTDRYDYTEVRAKRSGETVTVGFTDMDSGTKYYETVIPSRDAVIELNGEILTAATDDGNTAVYYLTVGDMQARAVAWIIISTR